MDSSDLLSGLLGLGAGLASQSIQTNAQLSALQMQTQAQAAQPVVLPAPNAITPTALVVIGIVIVGVILISK
jgi:hypothetical protein